MKPVKLATAAIALALLLAAGVCYFHSDDQPRPRLGLMTSLPIYWPDSSDFGAALSDEAQPHWAKAQLEESYRLLPLDTLAAPDSAAPSAEFKALDRLLLAQPAPLPPADFAALDQWVRTGGRLLLFADPVLTQDSEFALGDPRRPQVIAMLGPILQRWGLRLAVGDARTQVVWRGHTLPLQDPGVLMVRGSEFAECRVQAGGLIADCAVGQGRALVVADAAMLDGTQKMAGADKALLALVNAAFEDQ